MTEGQITENPDMVENDLAGADVSTGVTTDNENTQPESLPKETAQKIIARERQKAYEKGRRELMEELQAQQGDQQQQAPQQQYQQQSMGGMPQMSQEDIQRQIQQQIPQALQDHVQQFQMQQTVDSFVNKMQAAEQKYPGLESKLNELDYNDPKMLQLVQAANSLENTGEIMHELVNNPMKMGNLLTLAKDQPRLAMQALQSLSNSIKQNQVAIDENQSVNDPMSQLKSSPNAGADKGDMSVSDFRKMFKA